MVPLHIGIYSESLENPKYTQEQIKSFSLKRFLHPKNDIEFYRARVMARNIKLLGIRSDIDWKERGFGFEYLDYFPALERLRVHGHHLDFEEFLQYYPNDISQLSWYQCAPYYKQRLVNDEVRSFDYSILLEKPLENLDLAISGKKSELRITKENNSLKRLRLMTREEVELEFSNLTSLEYYIENITYNTRKDYYSLQHIKYLQLGGNQEMDFSFLNSIKNLRVLVLGVFKNIVDLSFLSQLDNLEYLCILDAGNLVSLDGLEKLKNLRYFFMTIKKKFNLDSLSKLDECPSIEKFGFNYPSMKREKLFAELESKYPDRFSHRIYAAYVNSDDTISLSTTKIEY